MNIRFGRIFSGNAFSLTLAAILLVAGSVLIVSRTLNYHNTNPVPSGDAQEYFWQAEVIYNLSPSANQMLDRWPGFPAVVAGLWTITGRSALVQNMASAACQVLACLLIFMVLYRNGKRMAALLSLFFLLFNPLIIKYSTIGLTETFFVLLILCLYVLLFYAGKHRWLLLPLSIAVSVLLVLSKEEGVYVFAWMMTLFIVRNLRNRCFNVKSILLFLITIVAAGSALYLYAHYKEIHAIVPIKYRIGKFFFYREFLSGKIADYDGAQFFSMISPFNWLILHSPEEMFQLLIRSFKALYMALDAYFFPGSTVLLAAGIIAALRYGYLFEVLIVVPLVSFYAFNFHLQTELRYPVSFVMLIVPLALAGIESLNVSRLKWKVKPTGAIIAVTVIFTILFWNMESYHDPVRIFGHEKEKPEKNFEDSLFLGLDSGNWEFVSRVSREGCSRYPDWIYFRLGSALADYKDGQGRRAYQTLDNIMASTPWIVEAHYIKYYLLQLDNRPAEAAQALTSALEIRPEFRPLQDLISKLEKEEYLQENYKLPPESSSPFTVYRKYSFPEKRAMQSFLWWCGMLERQFPSDRDFPSVVPD